MKGEIVAVKQVPDAKKLAIHFSACGRQELVDPDCQARDGGSGLFAFGTTAPVLFLQH
jgi:hypothetical protein